MLDELGHLSEKTCHLRQRQVDFFSLANQLVGFSFVGVASAVLIVNVPGLIDFSRVLSAMHFSSWLSSSQVAYVEAPDFIVLTRKIEWRNK